MDTENEFILLRDNTEGISILRRAVPVIRLYLRAGSSGEQEAARAALERLASTISADWRKRRAPHGWIWNLPTHEIYQAATRSCRWQLTELDPPEFDETVYDGLFDRQPSAAVNVTS